MAHRSRKVDLETVLRLVKQLTPLEQARLIELVVPEIERALIVRPSDTRTSLLGLVKDYGPAPSAEEIDASRHEAWANFPRDAG